MIPGRTKLSCLAAALAVLLLWPGPGLGQVAAGAAALTAPEEAVQKATAAWRVAALDLDARVAKMLPCDPKAQTAIEQASRTSQARLTALADYYQTAAAIAATRTEGARRLLAAERARAATLTSSSEEAQQVLADAERQAQDLEAAARDQSALSGALAALRQAVEATRLRATTAKERQSRVQPMLDALAKLVDAYDAREKALAGAIAAFNTERTRWNAYYAARLARGQVECSATTPTSAAKPATAKPKPKAKTSTKVKTK